MERSDPDLDLEEIQDDLGRVVEELRQEARGGPRLRRGENKLIFQTMKDELDEYPLRAALLLLSAKFGDYDFERLKPAAVGIELLNLAVRKHYPRPGARVQGLKTRVMGQGAREEGRRTKDEASFGKLRIKPSSDNFSLITGDYYYARAVSLGSTFDDTRVVKIMVQAISEIAQGEVESQKSLNKSALKKLASLYSASCHLGALISGVSEVATKVLKEYGLNLGAAYRLTSEMHEKGEPQKFLTLARKALVDLPSNKHRFHLEQLADSIP
ncbi:MAG: polyprenyl synthetase family protein [Actinomycetota bacterium]|nr:polyprenyl synthetase family protein [Actinomycetota bacterium]